MIIKGICGLISPPLPSGSIALALPIYLLLGYKSLIFSRFASKIRLDLLLLQICTSLLFISLVNSTLNMYAVILFTIVFCCRISVDIHQLYFRAVKSVY